MGRRGRQAVGPDVLPDLLSRDISVQQEDFELLWREGVAVSHPMASTLENRPRLLDGNLHLTDVVPRRADSINPAADAVSDDPLKPIGIDAIHKCDHLGQCIAQWGVIL